MIGFEKFDTCMIQLELVVYLFHNFFQFVHTMETNGSILYLDPTTGLITGHSEIFGGPIFTKLVYGISIPNFRVYYNNYFTN